MAAIMAVTNGKRPAWHVTVLMFSGLVLIAATFIFTELGFPFHFEFVIGGLALCGISITQWGDKK